MGLLNFDVKLPERKSFRGTNQIAWDSTSLKSFKFCPYHYYLSIVCGLIPVGESVHLKFGLLYHEGQEYFQKCLTAGADRETAICDTIKHILTRTWEARLNRPWVSLHDTKNRYTLVRSLLDYFDHYSEEDPFANVLQPNGKPCTELSFRYKSSYETSDGDPYWICGHIDRLVTKDDRLYILDFKTTQGYLNDAYWRGYTPNNQITLYYYSGQIIFNTRIHGLIIDAIRITPKESEFERRQIARTDEQLEEWYKDLGYWLAFAETCSKQNYWPKNDHSCVVGYKTCEYISICGNCPSTRETWLKSGWSVRGQPWDPATARGEE